MTVAHSITSSARASTLAGISRLFTFEDAAGTQVRD
jgi:hypothetical protein